MEHDPHEHGVRVSPIQEAQVGIALGVAGVQVPQTPLQRPGRQMGAGEPHEVHQKVPKEKPKPSQHHSHDEGWKSFESFQKRRKRK